MRRIESISWVVYRMTIHGTASETYAVCTQREWEEIERAHPGYHKLMQAGIAHEAEAERLARAAAKKPKVAEPVPSRPQAEDDDFDEPILTPA
jgi:hypothetical protein